MGLGEFSGETYNAGWKEADDTIIGVIPTHILSMLCNLREFQSIIQRFPT